MFPVRSLILRALILTVALGAAAPAAQALNVPEGTMIEAWKITCEGGPCRAFFSIRQGESVALTWSLLHDRASGQVSSVIRVPTGVALPPGLRIYVTDTQGFDAAFQVCEADGCTAVVVLDAEMQAAMAVAERVRVAMVPYGAQAPVAYEVPVKGFRAALDAL